MKKISIKVNTKKINAMLKALGEMGTFEFNADYESYIVVVTHKDKGEVLRGVRDKEKDIWIINHAEDLFV